MARRASDLVTDSRLDTLFLPGGNSVQHRRVVPDPHSSSRRPKSVRETWHRKEELGRGAFGCVWLQEMESEKYLDISARYRAVKEIMKSTDVRGPQIDYSRELEAIAKFSHERYAHCFVKSFGWYESNQRIFVAMEFLPFGDLQRYIKGGLPEPEACLITSQLIEGLEFMHSNGFVHRDLKPTNVLVHTPGPDWWVKIGDFGISKRLHESTELKTVVGTPGFLAPELMGLLPKPGDGYSFALDSWSLGEMVVRMITGSPCFENLMTLVQYITGVEPFSNPTLVQKSSTLCADFVQGLMRPRPQDRTVLGSAVTHLWLAANDGGVNADADPMSKFSTWVTAELLVNNVDSLGLPEDSTHSLEWTSFRQLSISDATTTATIRDHRQDTVKSGAQGSHQTASSTSSGPATPQDNQDQPAGPHRGLRTMIQTFRVALKPNISTGDEEREPSDFFQVTPPEGQIMEMLKFRQLFLAIALDGVLKILLTPGNLKVLYGDHVSTEKIQRKYERLRDIKKALEGLRSACWPLPREDRGLISALVSSMSTIGIKFQGVCDFLVQDIHHFVLMTVIASDLSIPCFGISSSLVRIDDTPSILLLSPGEDLALQEISAAQILVHTLTEWLTYNLVTKFGSDYAVSEADMHFFDDAVKFADNFEIDMGSRNFVENLSGTASRDLKTWSKPTMPVKVDFDEPRFHEFEEGYFRIESREWERPGLLLANIVDKVFVLASWKPLKGFYMIFPPIPQSQIQIRQVAERDVLQLVIRDGHGADEWTEKIDCYGISREACARLLDGTYSC